MIKKNCIADFALPADHRVKIKENEKRDKYLDLAGELRKLWNIKAMVKTIIIGAHIIIIMTIIIIINNFENLFF